MLNINLIPYAYAVCLLLCCVGPVLAAKTEIQPTLVSEMIQSGVMTIQDYNHLEDIHMIIVKGGKVTDDDLGFVINLMETDPPNPRELVFRRVITAAYASGYHRWSQTQKARLFQAAMWLLAQPKPRNQLVNGPSTDALPALFLFDYVHDRRVLPYVRVMETDPHAEGAADAKKIYKSIAGDKK